MKEVEQMLGEMRKEREIACPHCGTTQSNDDYQYPVTYWGDDSYHEMECEECNRKFWVKEDVRRTYRVAKTYEELGL